MKKFIADVKSSLKRLDEKKDPFFQENPPQRHQDYSHGIPTIMAPPTSEDVLRYRLHYGTNMGNVFVLEKWMKESNFPDTWKQSNGSELDAVLHTQRRDGLENTRNKCETNWREAISNEGLRQLAVDFKCTSIRVPIGYFTLGPQWCKDTPFAEVGSVYVNAWAAVKDLARRAKEWGIGTLIDFHAVYGGANREDHSGTTSGRADLWENRRNQERATKALAYIAEQIKSGALVGVLGIQVCNEAIYQAKGMYQWYDEVIKAIGRVDESIPIYISDGWDLEACLQWVNGRNPLTTSPRNPVIIDTHKYYTYSDADRSQAPQQIIDRVPGEFQEIQKRSGNLLSNRGETQVIVGEYSCVLDTKTWERLQPGQSREAFVKQFGHAQCRTWCEKTAGSYFWTYHHGGEWSFKEQAEKGNLTPPKQFFIPSREVLNRVKTARDRKGQLASVDRAAHEGYWNSASPGKQFQHHLYSDGWELGYADALNFFKMRAEGSLDAKTRDLVGGGDKIGCLDVWIKKRLLESKVRGEFVWEWEQGFRKGVSSFYGVIGA